jgi:hypothetical protein
MICIIISIINTVISNDELDGLLEVADKSEELLVAEN